MLGSLENIFKKLLQLDLVKVFSLTAVSTLVRMLTAFVSIKIIASILGPSGIALVGQLNNFIVIILAISSAGINQGVTKYISQVNGSRTDEKKYIEVAFKITFALSIICGLLMIIINNFLSEKIFHSQEYGYVFIVFGFAIIFFSLNNLMLSIVNGFKQYRKFVTINILNSVVGLVATVALVYFWELKGALISLITYQSLMFFVTFWILRNEYWIKFLRWTKRIDPIIVKKYLHYTIMTITTAAVVPISQLYIRSYVINNISLNDAGYWEAMNKLSSVYLGVITSSLAVYFLPKLSELKTRAGLRKEIFTTYKIILPFLLVILIVIYTLRLFIIKLLFTEDFLPMVDLFKYQLLGDFFKISSWLLAFNMVAKSMTKTFVITEILASGLFITLSLYLVQINGVVGITQAYMINYIIYLVIMIIIFRKLLFSKL